MKKESVNPAKIRIPKEPARLHDDSPKGHSEPFAGVKTRENADKIVNNFLNLPLP